MLLCLACPRPCACEDRTERIDGADGWKELDYRNGALVEERTFDSNGALATERRFSPESLPILTERYVREGGRLVRIEATDAAGNSVGLRSYHYDREGRLLNVRSEGELGEGAVGTIATTCTPQGTWMKDGPEATILAYDETGRAVLLETMDEGKVSRIENRNYGEKGVPISTEIEDKKTETTTAITYDEEGRQTQRREVTAKGVESRTLYRYDEAGRVAVEERRSGGQVLSVQKSYDKDGKLSRVETRRDGTLVLAVDYAGNGRAETLYEDGKAFVKATYSGGRKVKDEFYDKGVLARTREYQ
jgi:antitoxin component YwqK of YwqJK toxin-antitoxin module